MQSIRFPALSMLSLALALSGAGLTRACAQEPSAPRSYDVQVTMKLNGQDVTDTVTWTENQPFTLSGNAGDRRWRAEFVLNRVPNADAGGARPTVRLAGTITEDGKTLAQPTLVGRLDGRMGVKVGDDVQLAFVVHEQAR